MDPLSFPDNPRLPSPRPSGAGIAPARLRAIVELLLLTLLAALLRRRARAEAPLPFGYEHSAQDWWIDLPHAASAPPGPALLEDALPRDILRQLYVLGPRPNRGMRPLSRATAPRRAPIARAPPNSVIRLNFPIRAKPPLSRGR